MSVSTGNPNALDPSITTEVLQSTAAQAGVKVPEKWEADFTVLMSGAKDALEQVVAMGGLPFLYEYPGGCWSDLVSTVSRFRH